MKSTCNDRLVKMWKGNFGSNLVRNFLTPVFLYGTCGRLHVHSIGMSGWATLSTSRCAGSPWSKHCQLRTHPRTRASVSQRSRCLDWFLILNKTLWNGLLFLQLWTPTGLVSSPKLPGSGFVGKYLVGIIAGRGGGCVGAVLRHSRGWKIPLLRSEQG